MTPEVLKILASALLVSLVSLGLKKSVVVFFAACALAGWWVTRGRKKAIAPAALAPAPTHKYRLIWGAASCLAGCFFWRGPEPHWFVGGFLQAMAYLAVLTAFGDSSAVSQGNSKVKSKGKAVLPPVKQKANLRVPGQRGRKRGNPAETGTSGWNPVFLVLMVLLLVCGAVSEYFFYIRNVNMGLGFLAATAILAWWTGRRRTESPSALPFNEKHLLAFILVLAALMRLPFLGQNFTGFQIDEANDLNSAFDIVQGTQHSPFITGWWGRATFEFALIADFFRVFGSSLAVARGFSAVCSLAMLWLFFRWCRFYFGATASFGASFLMSVSWYFLWGSHNTFPMVIQDLGVVASFYLLERGFREGKAAFFWWSGTLAGMTVMTYVWGRVAPYLIVAWIGFCFVLLEESKTLRQERRWGLLPWVGGLLWILGPFLGWLVTNRDFFGRTKELSLMHHVSIHHDYLLPFNTFFHTFFSIFTPFGGTDGRFALVDYPLFDPLSSLLFFMGLIRALANPRKRFSWVLLLGLGACLPANALAIQGDTPDPKYLNGQRIFCLVPFLYWGVAMGLDFLDRAFHGAQKRIRMAGAFLGALALAACLVWNGFCFYHEFPKRGPWSELGFDHMLTAEVIREYSPKDEIYLYPDGDSSVVQFLDHGYHWNRFDQNTLLPLSSPPKKDAVFILSPWNWSGGFYRELMAAYPHTTLKEYKERDGQPFLWALEVPQADFQKK